LFITTNLLSQNGVALMESIIESLESAISITGAVDSTYFHWHMYKIVCAFLHARQAIYHNLRRGLTNSD
jgi:hypothetical protein